MARARNTGKRNVKKGKKQQYKKKYTATIPMYPTPPKMFTQLVVNHQFTQNSSSTNYVSSVFRPTSYYDVDPSIGGPSFGGYTVFSTMYGRYRVLAFKYAVTFTNLEAFPIVVSTEAIASNVTPSTGTVSDYVESAIENQYGHSATLSPISSNPIRILKGYVNCMKLWGCPEAKTDSLWGASVGSNPVNNSWLRLATRSATGVNLANGVNIQLRIKSYGYFDNRYDLTS